MNFAYQNFKHAISAWVLAPTNVGPILILDATELALWMVGTLAPVIQLYVVPKEL